MSRPEFFGWLWSALAAMVWLLCSKAMRRLTQMLAVLPPLLLLAGCHSAFVEATVSNRTAKPLSVVELDYPSASFGLQTLAPGQDFHYRFKILGSGRLKLIYTDANEKEQHADGPELSEGQEGGLQVLVTPAGTEWRMHLHSASSH